MLRLADDCLQPAIRAPSWIGCRCSWHRRRLLESRGPARATVQRASNYSFIFLLFSQGRWFKIVGKCFRNSNSNFSKASRRALGYRLSGSSSGKAA